MAQDHCYTDIKADIPQLLSALGKVTPSGDAEETSYECLCTLHDPLKLGNDSRAPFVKLATGRVLLYPVVVLTTSQPAKLPYSNRQVQSIGVRLEEGDPSLHLKIDLCLRTSMVEVPSLDQEPSRRVERSPALMKELIEQFALAVHRWGVQKL